MSDPGETKPRRVLPPVFLLAALVAMGALHELAPAGISIKPYQVPEHLVTGGLFAHSRNPVYASMILGLAGIFVVLGTLTPALVVPVFAYLISVRFIALEERLLEDRFGDAYRDYAGRVRRWI